jgi:hypothetical protein
MAMSSEVAIALLWQSQARRNHLDELAELGEDVSTAQLRQAESAIRFAELQWLRARKSTSATVAA